MNNTIKVEFTIIAWLYWRVEMPIPYTDYPSIVDEELGYRVLSISTQNGSTPHTILNFKL